MLIDTHAHIYLDRFDADRDAMMTRAREAGVGIILQPAIDLPSIEAALRLCDHYDVCYAMAGLHPSETQDVTEADKTRLRAFCADSRVVAVGESGLDYYWDRTFVPEQHAALRWHAQLALAMDLPLVLHNRDQKGSMASSEDLIRILQEENESAPDGHRLRGVFHCFGGPPAMAQAVLDLGFHLGIGGTVTFKNGGVPEAIKNVPLDRIVLETDAPFLAPTPHRGRRNEPAYLPFVAQRLAELKGVSVETIAATTTATAKALFRLD